jgi:Flp pilus assembly protein TadG
MIYFAKLLLSCRRGSSAVEFAIIAPLFLMIFLSMIGYGIYLSAATSVQQMTEDAARAAIAGLDKIERQQLASDYIASAARDRPFIDPARLSVRVTESDAVAEQLIIQIDYDAETLPIWHLFTHAMPQSRTITRRSVVRLGGI